MRYVTIFLLLVLFSVTATAQRRPDRSVGLRLGIPSGIVYKKYLPAKKAIELGIGSVGAGWHHYYYENSFHSFDKYEGYNYTTHRVNSTLFLQAKYLMQDDIHIEGLTGKLDWYWGVGGLVKLASVTYYFRDENDITRSEKTTDFDIGPEGVIGMEYTFDDVPLTVFGDISLMIEIVDRPATLRGLSGVGVRYNF